MDIEVIARDPSIDGFCRRMHLSRSSYYNLRASGFGPREFTVGKLVRIGAEAEAEWVREREAARSGRAD
jgi:hypothetical protein